MSTATLKSLLDYLYGTLTPSNMRWVGEHLIERAMKEELTPKPYTIEEINTILNVAEQNYADGLGIPGEEVFRELEEEFSREDAEEDALLSAAPTKDELLREAV